MTMWNGFSTRLYIISWALIAFCSKSVYQDQMFAVFAMNLRKPRNIFFTCRIISNLRKDLCTRIKNTMGIHLWPTLAEVLLGKLDNTKDSITLNIIFLVFKQYVFQTLSAAQPLNIAGLMKRLKKVYKEQEYVAKIQFKIEKFNKMWNLIWFIYDPDCLKDFSVCWHPYVDVTSMFQYLKPLFYRTCVSDLFFKRKHPSRNYETMFILLFLFVFLEFWTA